MRLVTFDVDRTSVLEGEVVVLTLTVDKPLVEPFSVEIQTSNSGRTAEGTLSVMLCYFFSYIMLRMFVVYVLRCCSILFEDNASSINE